MRARPRFTPVRAALVLVVAVVLAGAGLAIAPGRSGSPASVLGANDQLRVLMAPPSTLDPAAAGDHGSAQVIAQLYEGVTAIDPGLNVRPALASSWDFLDGGNRIVFHLRPDLTFSDGTPLRGADVVRSWLRLIDPAHPSPLASLMLPVRGARERLAGSIPAGGVGLRANGNDVEVDLVRPTTDFPSVVAGPTFAVVPATVPDDPARAAGDRFVASGGYRLTNVGPGELVLQANERYWAGRPAIRTVHLVSDLGGRSIVDAWEAGDLDYTAIPGYDADWIRYDAQVGPDLRFESEPTVEYMGFDTRRPPFDDARVRQAFAQAVDWRRLVALDSADAAVATGMVPPGIPGASKRDFLPRHDPDAARRLLADAGYPDGRGFPTVTWGATAVGLADGAVADLKRELGVNVSFELMQFDDLYGRLQDDSPGIWTLAWVADYPGANDFLGVLLGTGESNNHGGWASPEFDAAIDEALSAGDAAATAAFEKAQAIVQRDAPVVPLEYGGNWWLARAGLLNASQGGLAIPRLAGFAWQAR